MGQPLHFAIKSEGVMRKGSKKGKHKQTGKGTPIKNHI